MKMSEQAIGIAQKLYDCRRTALFVLGPQRFKAKVEEFRPIIQAAMAKHDCDEVRATMEIVKLLNSGGHDGMPTLIAFAACVEILEPSLAA